MYPGQMGQLVCGGATLKCSFGLAPSTLDVLPANRVLAGSPTATIMDHLPLVNILPFGMCTSLDNPEVQASTTAALGVLTPMPCVPVTSAPWIPGSPTVLIGGKPALGTPCQCLCDWGGIIEVLEPGQLTTQVAS